MTSEKRIPPTQIENQEQRDYWHDDPVDLSGKHKRYCALHHHGFYIECGTCVQMEIRDLLKQLVNRFSPYGLLPSGAEADPSGPSPSGPASAPDGR